MSEVLRKALEQKAKAIAELNPRGKEQYCRGCYKEDTECSDCFWKTEKWVSLEDAVRVFDETFSSDKSFVHVSRKQLEDKISQMEKEWQIHLANDGGSCYCLSSPDACLPDRIAELKELLSASEASEHHFLTVSEAREKLKETSKETER